MEGGGIRLAVQQLGQVFFCNGNSLYISLQKPHIRLPADGGQPPLQLPDTGLPGVVPDDGPDYAVFDPQGALLQSVLRQLLWQQMAAGDLHLLLIGITGELNHLHAVQQGPGDCVRGVGGGDEHHLPQVHGNLQKMVPEGVVLLAVQHLQKSRRRVASVIAAHLVDLVQQQQWIHRPAAADGLDDPPRHGAYVGLPVAPDIRLIPDAAQGDPGQLPVQRLGHTDGNGGLAHAGRTHQADNLALALRIHLPDGDGLQNALFHLLQAVVVLFQHLSGGVHADPLPGGHIPGHLQADIQIVPDDCGLSAAVRLLGQLIDLFQQVLLRVLLQLEL